MSDFLRVFCREGAGVAVGDIAGFVEAGVYFDRMPGIEPDAVPWSSLTIRYDPDRRPIVLWRNGPGALLQEEIEEATAALERAGGPGAPQVRRCLARAAHAFAFEVGLTNLPEDAGAMVNCLAAYLARRCDGVIYAASDGFFDEGLVRVVTL